MAIAPNSSSGALQGCSPCILPIYKTLFSSRGSRVVPPYLDEKFWFYQGQSYRELPQHEVIDFVSVIQKWIDTGISFEFMYDLNKPEVTGKYVYDNIIRAWQQGIKCIYYTTQVQKDTNQIACEVCAN